MFSFKSMEGSLEKKTIILSKNKKKRLTYAHFLSMVKFRYLVILQT